MASNIPEKKNHVMCPKCSGDLKNPTLMPCRHIICESCINDMEELSQEDPSYRCAICKSLFPKTQSTQLTVIQELLHFVENAERETHCENCKQKTAQWRCRECKRYFCPDCRQHHDSLDFLKDHTWSNLGDAQPILDQRLFCVSHPKEPIRFHCANNQQFACALCTLSANKDVEYKEIEEALETVIPAVKKNQSKLQDEIQVAEKFLAKNDATAEQIKDGYEKMEEKMENKFKAVLEQTKADYEDQLGMNQLQYEEAMTKAKMIYEESVKVAKQQYDDSQKRAKDEQDVMLKKAEVDHNKLRAELYKAKRDQLRVIEQDNCKLELEIRSQKNVVDLCEAGLSAAQGATLLKVMGSGLQTSLYLHVVSKAFYREYLSLPIVGFVSSENLNEANAVGRLFRNSRYIPHALSDMHKLSTTLYQTFETNFQCRSSGLIKNQLWCTDGSNVIHIYSQNGIKLKDLNFTETGSCFSVVEFGENRVLLASDAGIFLLNTEGNLLQKIVPGSFCDVYILGDNLYALDHKEGIVRVLQKQSEDTFGEFHHFRIQNYSSTTNNTLQATFTHLYVAFSSTDNMFHRLKKLSNDRCVTRCIRQYSHPGYVAATHNRYSNGPGQPSILGADSSGAILITEDDRLMSMTSEGKMKVVELDCLKRNLTSVLITDNKLFVFYLEKVQQGGDRYVKRSYLKIYNICMK